MKTKKQIPAGQLRVGNILLEGRKEVKITSVEACTQRDCVHVNQNDCYWIYSLITISKKEGD